MAVKWNQGTAVVQRTVPACPICDQHVTKSFITDGYRLFACAKCDFVFIDPAVVDDVYKNDLFGDAYFTGGGAGYPDYLREERVLYAHGRRYGELLSRVGAKHVLDVGAAAGFILHGIEDAGCTGVGIEPNATMADFARRRPDADVRTTTLERFETTERFDAVVILQVVDHVENLRTSFGKVQAVTKPGGWCLIEFDDRASITAHLFGRHWHGYSPPTVQRVFSLRALRRLLQQYGYTLHASGYPKKFLHVDHAVSLLRYKTAGWPGGKIFSSVSGALPRELNVRYVGDDIKWALFRKT